MRLLELERANELNGEDDLGVGDEPESAALLARDAKEWKVRDVFPSFSIVLLTAYSNKIIMPSSVFLTFASKRHRTKSRSPVSYIARSLSASTILTIIILRSQKGPQAPP